MIPTFFKTPDFQGSKHDIYCVVAANGNFVVRNTGLFTSVTEAAIPGLVKQEPDITLRFPKLPQQLLESIYGFFRWTWEEHESEAIVLLYYDPAKCGFAVEVPPQKVLRYRSGGRWRTEARLEYEAIRRPDHLLKLGDAHSHGEMPAFFSAADDRDDRDEGLRIVMGDIDRARPSIRVSFIAGGMRFHLPVEQVLEDFTAPAQPPPAWMRQVVCAYEGLTAATKGNGRDSWY